MKFTHSTIWDAWADSLIPPRETHSPHTGSRWPKPDEITTAHEREAHEDSFPDWLIQRAERLLGLCDESIFIGQDSTEEDIFTIASHLADHYATRNHENGQCVTIGCKERSESEFSLRCHLHQPYTHGDRQAPYGFDDSTSEDEERPFIEYEDHFSTYTRVEWRRSRSSRKAQHYTTQQNTYTNDVQESN